jgi:hypothetical protein
LACGLCAEEFSVKLRHTGFLVGVVLILIYIDCYFLREKNFPDATVKQRNALEEYGEHNVFKIEIQSKNAYMVIEKNGNNNWKMAEPFAWPVNPFAVRKFFQILKQNPDLSAGYTLKLSKKGQTKTLIGAGTMVDPSAEECLAGIMNLGTSFWCQRSICPFKSSEIIRCTLVFHGQDREFLFSKSNATWNFERPIEIEADESTVQKFLEWMIHLEIFPQTKDMAMENMAKNKKDGDPENFFQNPYVTIALVDGRQRKFTMICGEYYRRDEGAKIVRYAWLEDCSAVFEIPWSGEWDHPLQALCTQSLFPKVQSVTFAHDQKKLFLSRNEAGDWNILKFSNEFPLLQSLENFDIRSLLLLFSLAQPLDVVTKAVISNVAAAERLFLEVNGMLKFEAFFSEDMAYLVPMHKNYAIRIDADLLQKLFKIIRNV